VLAITMPDVAPIAVAEHVPDMREALRSIGVSEAAIGQPLAEFTSADADLTDRSGKLEKERLALTAPARPDAPVLPGLVILANDPMFLTSLNRVGIALYVLLSVAILALVIRRAARLSGHYDACADALTLSGGVADEHFVSLAQTLSPLRGKGQSAPASMISPK
jgi:hypothetical protein